AQHRLGADALARGAADDGRDAVPERHVRLAHRSLDDAVVAEREDPALAQIEVAAVDLALGDRDEPQVRLDLAHPQGRFDREIEAAPLEVGTCVEEHGAGEAVEAPKEREVAAAALDE